jgi:hypothetical protein
LNWTGWNGRTEYTYWLHDIESFPNLAYTGEAGWRRKRPRLEDIALIKASIPEPARIVSDLTAGGGGGGGGGVNHHKPLLHILSSTATFKLKLVHQQGKPLKYLKSTSLQQRHAVGDQWTLLDPEGAPMRDMTGEYATFETTDHFFQIHPEVTTLLQSQE